MPKEKQESIFLQKWKSQMTEMMVLKYSKEGKKVSRKKISDYLDKIIAKRLRNMKVDLFNNYRAGLTVHTDFLGLIDFIEKNKLILGGGATLFVNHDQKDNPVIYYLIDNMAERSAIKKRNKTLPEGSFELLMGELASANVKLKNNTFYGAIGNPFFRLFNIFVAEAITMTGRNIISTAATGFEGFLGDNVDFNEINEVYNFIFNIKEDVSEYYNNVNLIHLETMPLLTDEMVCERILSKCKFDMSDTARNNLVATICNCDTSTKVLLYYKNNLYEFLRIPLISDKFAYIIQNIGVLMAPDTKLIENDEIRTLVDEMWVLLETYVFYNHPIYDRIRKTQYTDKKSVFYIDTDSNFLGLNPFVQFTKNEVLMNNYHGASETDTEFTIVNLLTVMLSNVVRENLFSLARNMNVPEAFVPKLNMKNEFYFRRIIFTDRKKRYIALRILQEGRLLNKGLGKDELKGFDFKKSVTKPTIKEFYTNLCMEEILRADKINTRSIFVSLINFKNEMMRSLKAMEPTYYRQAAVQLAEHYKMPYSNSGYKALLLWNTLCPNYAMEPPVNVDIIPIKELAMSQKTGKYNRNLEMFAEKYPETFEILNTQILNNPNPEIRGMKLNYIAVPRGMNYNIPEWLPELLDVESIVDGNINMIVSVLNSVGIKTLIKGESGRPHMTNIIDL